MCLFQEGAGFVSRLQPDVLKAVAVTHWLNYERLCTHYVVVLFTRSDLTFAVTTYAPKYYCTC